ncbi:F-box/kelch-repeat protein SKIP6 [Cannabis sativa]|nr:F-box/kelch-repeat protein SKIP6 [Cannabis sativa]
MVCYSGEHSSSFMASGKDKKQSQQPELAADILIPSLTNDVALNCLARVPRWHHIILSQVSRPIRSLLFSHQFYTARSILNCTHDLLYIRVGSYSAWPATWFYIQQKPDPSLTRNGALIRVPQQPLHIESSAYAAVGYKIYVLGGFVDGEFSSHVWILDCRFHTWERGPNMKMARCGASAAVLGGKIYVAGGGGGPSSSHGGTHWVESFDPDIGVWEAVPCPDGVRNKWVSDCAIVGGGVCIWVGQTGFKFDPKTNVWEAFENELQSGWNGQNCVVNGVLYCYDSCGRFKGFDEVNGRWKEVNGVVKDLPAYMSGARMVSLEGKLVVVWGESDLNGVFEHFQKKRMELQWAEIEVKKDGNGDFWGKVYWWGNIEIPDWILGRCPLFYHCLSVSI